MLYNALTTYDWFPVYSETSGDTAFDILNVAVTQAIDLVIPPGYIKDYKYSYCYSDKLTFYIENTLFL